MDSVLHRTACPIYTQRREWCNAGPYASDSTEVAAAAQSLEDVRSLHKRPGSSTVLTLKALSEHLKRTEIKPAQFEQQVLGWPAAKNQLNGNPKCK